MKIAHIFSYFGDGGAEAHAIMLINQAKSNGHETLLIVGDISRNAKTILEKNDIKYIQINLGSSFNPVILSKSVMQLKKIITNESVDILHTHMLREQSIGIITKLLGCKFILIRTFHRFDQFNRKMKPLMGFYKKYTDSFISTSDLMSEYMNENGITENVRLIYNGVEQINTKSHGKSIGFIGRLTEEKGIFDFIRENTGLLTSQSMVVAGDGPLLNDIKNFVSENKLNIKILGNISDKVSFYEQISVLVLPSRTEVMPLVVLEAYSCGLPVVAFDIAPLRKLISSNNGMLVENNNYQQMGEAAIGLIDITSQFKNNIDLFNEKYSADIMWRATAELYHELIKKR